MTENVILSPIYYPDTVNPTGGEAVETLETRFSHFQQYNKGGGSLQSVTFWCDPGPGLFPFFAAWIL